MTRFARAKGSKACNDRTPEEATSWEAMKNQLSESAKQSESTKKVTKSAKQLLKEKEEPFYSEKPVNTKSDWAEFEAPKNVEKQDKKLHRIKKGKVKKSTSKTPVKREKGDPEKIKAKKIKRKMQKIAKLENKKKIEKNNSESHGEKVENESQAKTFQKLSKRQKRNQKNLQKKESEKKLKSSDSGDENNDDSKKDENVEKNEEKEIKKNGRVDSFPKKYPNQKPGKSHHKRVAKIKDDKEHKRRKPDSGNQFMFLNGEKVELEKYDGFPIRKEDAERLKELKKNMQLKGIPKKELDAAMKLERRKAEKALTRMRKFVCFHCRKSGHNLSDCPELDREENTTGICFKCGSTEHTHFECKVAKVEDFRFARCFICREQGHVAKQCPDNPRGVYPQGGSCKICGDVTHLVKDCPVTIKKKEETAITVNTISDAHLESLDDELQKKPQVVQVKKEKIVKF